MKKNKTIALVIVGLTAGGAERVLSLLANSLVTKYNVLIITLVKTEIFYEIHSDIKILNCSRKINPSRGIVDALRSNYHLYKKIKIFFKENKVDSALAFMTRANILTTLAGNQLKIPVIISDRNNPWETDKSLTKFWIHARTYVYPKAKYVVLQTRKIASFYEQFVPHHKVKIIPNPINPKFIEEKTEKNNIILNVGRLNHQKNQVVLIEAFSKINASGWELHIIGEGEERKKLQNKINSFEMQDKIKLLGTTTNVQKHYMQSKIFAFTSIFEGFPNALLEAMFFGLPCISTDCPTGPSELIQNGVNGFLIPVGSSEILAGKLTELINNETMRDEFGRKAKESVAKYHIDRISEEWTSLID